MGTEITEGGQAAYDALFKADPAAPIEERFDPEFVDHDPAEGQPAGGAGLAWYWTQFGQSFSEIEHSLLETIATPEHIVTVHQISAKHTGEWLGHPPTNRRFTARGVQVVRLKNGKPIERWGSTDQLGMLQQLGLT
jgi:predicted ester cyclase